MADSPRDDPSTTKISASNGTHSGAALANGVIESPMATAGITGSGNEKRMLLELQDGFSVEGRSFGHDRSVAGEVIFSTGMIGYPESLTDPSYSGQILVMTWPLAGNYGVPSRTTMDDLLNDIPAHFEAATIHVAGLVVASYCGEDYSHHLASSSLGTWLKEQKVPAVYGIDTRALTKRIREEGSMLGRLSVECIMSNGVATSTESNQPVPHGLQIHFDRLDWVDPNTRNLVADVSCREPISYAPSAVSVLLHPSGRPLRVICVDVGLKFNQIRCLVSRGIEVLRVPWNFDFSGMGKDYDGLFISNGPGDPAVVTETIQHISRAIEEARTPVFGICLGHQLIARAAGAETVKLKFGNRGLNIPCTNRISGRCYITPQNHGFAVDAMSLPPDWDELFVNANDESNEGIRHKSRPIFSVQFHPEAAPGPRDTEFLFDIFIDAIKKSVQDVKYLLQPIVFPKGPLDEDAESYPRVSVKKVLLIGSGGLSIGQAGEFDYSGSQAIKALKEEGIYTVLINPNIATIQTSKGLADKVYFLPVTADTVRKVIKHERPDAIYVTFGGQTALKVGMELKDELESLGVLVLGTPIETIITTEDRSAFANEMEKIGEKCAKSVSTATIEEALAAGEEIGYPVIARAGYALGGLGSGFADNREQLEDICKKAFAVSPEVLVERSMKGWKEIEYEVVRDAAGNCVTVCNMENFDPLGIHTGDSIVVAPSQTLTDEDYQMLRTTAINVISHLGVVGECNIQYALNPDSKEYCIIEVNARLSRSSALASKATGYPLAFVAAKLGLGIPLNEISNSITKATCACFEPSLDYVVVKIPRWDLKKFTRVSTKLNSAMKSVGEVMAIGRTFEEAIQKAIRAVDHSNLGFNETETPLMKIVDELQTPSDQRMFAIANALHEGYTVDRIWQLTRIDKWFLNRLKALSDFGKFLSTFNSTSQDLSTLIPLLRRSKELGFSDLQIARFWKSTELAIRRMRVEAGITPMVHQIDTVAAEFPAMTNYLYLTYNGTEHDIDFKDHGVLVLGSGVYRIGSSVEFDFCSVQTVNTLRQSGYKTVMVNCNPETVSTDWSSADRLYFENITLESVLDIYHLESASGVIISMGGQLAQNLAPQLDKTNVKVLGTSPEMIDGAENRYKFSRMLDTIYIDQPRWERSTSLNAAKAFCDRVSYPVLVRPSYVLSGAAMNIVYGQKDLESYLNQAEEVSNEHPVVISKYIQNAKEIEMDAIAVGGKMIAHFISEHVENAGVHSGDATLILPPQDLDPETVRRIEGATRKISNMLNITGPFNIQFIAKNREIKVIECNIRASRSLPFVSKVMGVDLIGLATRGMMGLPVEEYPTPSIPDNYVGVKVPQFSFSRLSGADPVLGVEMASTGEVACFGRDKFEAYLKGLLSTGFRLPEKNILLSLGSHNERMELLPSIQRLHKLGYKIFATKGTHDFLDSNGVPAQYLEDLGSDSEYKEYSLSHFLDNGLVDLYINLPSNNHFRRPASYTSSGYITRRKAIDFQVPLVTNVKNAKMLIEAISRQFDLDILPIDSKASHETIRIPGLINISTFVPGIAEEDNFDFELVTKASIAAGFSMLRIMPLGMDGDVSDARSLRLAQANCSKGAFCDYNLSIAASPTNAKHTGQLLGQTASLFIPFNRTPQKAGSVVDITRHFETWPSHKPIVTDAKTTDLASLLLLASLHDRRLHVTSVTTAEDVQLIALSKAKGLLVTCDVSVYSLFFSQENFPLDLLPTKNDQEVLWMHLSTIDAFSIGYIPYQLAELVHGGATPAAGIADTLPLLFSAVKDKRLSVDDIVSRLYTNPKRIFDLVEDDSFVEVEIDRDHIFQSTSVWSPVDGRSVVGSVTRVTFRGKTVCLDGRLMPEPPSGIDLSSHLERFPSPEARPVFSPKAKPEAEIMAERRDSIITSQRQVPTTRSQSTWPVLHPIPDDTVPPLHPAPTLQSSMMDLISTSSFKGRHILSVSQVSRDDLHRLFTVAAEMRLGVKRHGVLDILRGRVLCTLFYEPSTRTSASFDAAMQRLGGRTVPIATSYSSTQKGESLSDTLRTLGCYGDAIVLRHPDPESANIAGKCSSVPIINGGNGSSEHPTQAFMDLFTIREELGSVTNLVITFVGDLRYGRTVHSLIKLLAHYTVSVQLIAPKGLSLPKDLRQSLISRGQLIAESEELEPKLVNKSDVLYCTRVQKERFESPEEHERLKDKLVVDNAMISHAKQKMIIMHPLPRNKEIDEAVDLDQRAAYFRQMRYGLYCRMALLALVMAP